MKILKDLLSMRNFFTSAVLAITLLTPSCASLELGDIARAERYLSVLHTLADELLDVPELGERLGADDILALSERLRAAEKLLEMAKGGQIALEKEQWGEIIALSIELAKIIKDLKD